MIEKEDKYKMLVINMISLIKLIEGGPAIFIAVRRNHSKDIDGTRFIRPLVRNMLRE